MRYKEQWENRAACFNSVNETECSSTSYLLPISGVSSYQDEVKDHPENALPLFEVKRGSRIQLLFPFASFPSPSFLGESGCPPAAPVPTFPPQSPMT